MRQLEESQQDHDRTALAAALKFTGNRDCDLKLYKEASLVTACPAETHDTELRPAAFNETC
jgi:hypothetical protein